MKAFDCVQGSPEWWQLRRGIPTCSNFDRILTPKTLKLSSQVDSYIHELIADRFRLTPPDGTENYVSRPMLNGLNTEPEARRWYEMEVGAEVKRVGFVTTDDGRFGGSPDSLVGEDGGLELKCPELKTHVKYLLDGVLPDDYRPQVHGYLIVTGRPWWDFVSYSPGLDPFRIRVTPNLFTDTLRDALEQFDRRYKELLSKIKGAA